MLTPQYLSNIPESVVKIYLDLESDIMVDIARRIKKTGNITDTAIWQAKKLEELGASREYIAKRIALALKLSEKEVLRIFNEACYKSLKKDETIINIHSWTKVLSSAIFTAAIESGFKIFITVHEYFLLCPNGAFYDFVGNHICERPPLSLMCIICSCDKRHYYHIFPSYLVKYNILYLLFL